MQDSEISAVVNLYLEDSTIDQNTKLQKLKDLVLEIAHRWKIDRDINKVVTFLTLQKYMEIAEEAVSTLGVVVQSNQTLQEQLELFKADDKKIIQNERPNKSKEKKLIDLVLRLRSELEIAYNDYDNLKSSLHKP